MSIKKIAQMTGVSPATVSRVLNNPAYKCSSEQMREKIWKAAMELNYVPNEAARNLKLGTHSKEKTCYLGILMTRVDASRTDSFFYELCWIIESEIHKQMGNQGNVIITSNRKVCFSDVDQLVCSVIVFDKIRIYQILSVDLNQIRKQEMEIRQ